MKHTPAPWIYDDGAVTANDGSQMICALPLMFKETTANAKLISAAPELLEALIECLDGVQELNGEYQDGWDEVINKTKAAIKKATE